MRCEALAAAALLCALALCAVEPLAEAAMNAAKRKTINRVRTMGSMRRIESSFSVGQLRPLDEYLRGYGFV